MDYKKLYFREEEFYEDHGIEFHLGREATNIVNRHGRPYLELSDEYKMVIEASFGISWQLSFRNMMRWWSPRVPLPRIEKFLEQKKLKIVSILEE